MACAENCSNFGLVSSGLRVLRLMLPEMPPSIMSAVWFLNTSTLPINSGGTSWNERPRPLLAEKVSRPLNSLRVLGNPRSVTPLPSVEKWSGSSLAAKRSIEMPAMRCSASSTLTSGNALMSVAEIASIWVSASRFMSCARISAPRMPTTVTLSRSLGSSLVAVSDLVSCVGVASCAITGEVIASSNAVASRCFLGTACCCFMGIPPLQGFARKRLGIRIFFHTRQGAGDRCGGIRKAN